MSGLDASHTIRIGPPVASSAMAVRVASAPSGVRTARSSALGGLRFGMILGIIGAHAVIGVASALSSVAATLYGAAVVVTAVIVILGSSTPSRVLAATAYAGVCDAFWRMTDARVPWELSKYLVAFGAVMVLLRFVRSWRGALLPLVTIALLLPGILASALDEGIGFARDNASSYEMGVISFALAALAFRHVIATKDEAWTLSWVILGPLIATLSATSYFVLTTPDIEFGSESNFAVTGGYGPNQISSAMGLIMVICLLAAFLPHARRFWPILAGLGVWAMWATFLTFSRGGIYSFALAGAAMALIGIGSRGSRLRTLLIAVAAVIGIVTVFSAANDFTGNWLDTRYSDSQTAGRSTIAEMDLAVFGSHPITGVGTGRAPEFRTQDRLGEAGAHTEFTRLLAEHGVFGIGVLAMMAAILVQGYRRSLSYWNRLMVAALSMWSLSTMLHAATRISAVGLMLALTQVRVADDDQQAVEPDITRQPRAQSVRPR